MCNPCGRIDENRILKLDLKLQVSICLPCNNGTNTGCKKIDDDAYSVYHAIWEEMRKRIDSNVAIFTTRSDSTHDCEPEHALSGEQLVSGDPKVLEIEEPAQ